MACEGGARALGGAAQRPVLPAARATARSSANGRGAQLRHGLRRQLLRDPARRVGRRRRRPARAGELVERGLEVMAAINAADRPVHPADERIGGCKHVVFTAPGEDGPRSQRSATSIHPGWLDRSPCGTGTSAKLAALHARGELAVGEEFVNRSVIGTRFGGADRRGDRGRGAARGRARRSPAGPGSPAWASTCSIPTTRSRRASRSEVVRGRRSSAPGIVGCADGVGARPRAA